MPFSHNRFDEHMRQFIAQSDCQTWLDVGAGAGKYGKMIREILPDAHITGVEINTDYINKYKLEDKYDVVLPVNAMGLMDEPQQTYDAIILGDILEHLPKSQGVDLINFLVYRCKLMFIIYPIGSIQNGYQSYSNEAHISVWGAADFDNFKKHGIHCEDESHLIIIDGYIEHERLGTKCPGLISSP